MNYDTFHKPVLLKEVLYYLKPQKGDVIFEGTLGGAGHTIEIIKAIAPTGKIIGVDLDSQAMSTATTKLKKAGFLDHVYMVRDNFANVSSILKDLGIKQLDGFLLDLGISSLQIEKSGRGFSYIRDETLDMRFDNRQRITAADILNTYSKEKLREIFFKYGEERWSSRIAKNIVIYRQDEEIKFTSQLIEIIKKSIPGSYRYRSRGHPAKRVFQALRIEVNKELDNLEKAIKSGFEFLGPGRRMVIVSYHSLEDRIVKKCFDFFSGLCICPPNFPVCRCNAKKRGKSITKKPVIPSSGEIDENPRAKSAKMRVFEKI